MADSSTEPASGQHAADIGAMPSNPYSPLVGKTYKWLLVVPFACALIALGHLAFGLRTAMPVAARWGDFVVKGYELVEKGRQAELSGRDLSHAGVTRFEAAPREAGKNTISIGVVPVRLRNT